MCVRERSRERGREGEGGREEGRKGGREGGGEREVLGTVRIHGGLSRSVLRPVSGLGFEF